jgi:hypothetical protein
LVSPRSLCKAVSPSASLSAGMIANTDVNKSMRNPLAQKHTILPAKN